MNSFDELPDDLQERLKREMERVPAPSGFANRVMERVNAQQRTGRLMVMPKRSGWMAVAAMLLVGILPGGWQWRQQELRKEREQAAVVQQRFDIAMQVTQKTLAEVQVRVGKTVRESVRQ